MVRIHLQKVAATWGYWGQRSEILHGTLYGQYTCHIKIQAQSEKKLIFGHLNDDADWNDHANIDGNDYENIEYWI